LHLRRKEEESLLNTLDCQSCEEKEKGSKSATRKHEKRDHIRSRRQGSDRAVYLPPWDAERVGQITPVALLELRGRGEKRNANCPHFVFLADGGKNMPVFRFGRDAAGSGAGEAKKREKERRMTV